MFDRFTDKSRKVMALARKEAQRFNHDFIGIEHILLGLIQEATGVAAKVLEKLGVETNEIRIQIEKTVVSGPSMVTLGQIPFTPGAKKVLELAMESANELGHNYIGTEHLLLGVLREEKNVGAQVLSDLGVDVEDVQEMVRELCPPKAAARAGDPTDEFAVDLTSLAHQGKLEPVVGREEEIAEVLRVLSRRSRCHPVLVGATGAGRAAVARGVAHAIAGATVPDPLRGLSVMRLEVTLLTSGSRLVTGLEKRWRDFARGILRRHNFALIVDRLKTLVDLAPFLRPDLGVHSRRFITTATPDELERALADDPSLAKRLYPVPVAPLSPAATLEVLRLQRAGLEAHHGVAYTDDALAACVELAEGRAFPLPLAALDLLDEVGSTVRCRTAAPAPEGEKEPPARVDADVVREISARRP